MQIEYSGGTIRHTATTEKPVAEQRKFYDEQTQNMKRRLFDMVTEKENSRILEVMKGKTPQLQNERSYVKLIIDAGMAEDKHHKILDLYDAELNWRRVTHCGFHVGKSC